MKRTKNMFYKESEESRELELFAENDGDLYRGRILPIINSLTKKAKKGIYDSEKAVDAFYYVADAAAKMYGRYYGGSFTVQERFTVAVNMEEYYKEQVFFDIENA